jgi:hypothetical protein
LPFSSGTITEKYPQQAPRTRQNLLTACAISLQLQWRCVAAQEKRDGGIASGLTVLTGA